MKNKTFYKVLAAVTAVGCISTIALVIWTAVLYKDCSIISFIANGR